jgi:hypothetical protein
MSPANDGKKKTKPKHRPDKGDARRPGLPPETSILDVKTLTSPKGRKYRILRTDEKDAYEEEDEK